MAPHDLCDLCTLLAGGSSHHNGTDQMVMRKTYVRTMKDMTDQWTMFAIYNELSLPNQGPDSHACM